MAINAFFAVMGLVFAFVSMVLLEVAKAIRGE